MKSSTKIILVLGGAGAATGALVWYLSNPAAGGGGGGVAGGGGGRMGYGLTPWLFRGWSPPGNSVVSGGGAATGTTHGGFGTTAHAVSG